MALGPGPGRTTRRTAPVARTAARPAPVVPLRALDVRRTGSDVSVLTVGADRTLLQALEDAGIVVPSTCREGICGSCETAVLAGAVDHRDHLLSAEEKERGDVMLVRVSRAGGPRPTLDL